MLLISTLNIWKSNQGSQELSQHATDDMRQKTKQQLVAVRDLKRSEIEDYFGTIRDQVITFSNDVMIIDAMRDMSSAFNSAVEDRNLDAAQIQDMRQELLCYYEQNFAQKVPDTD